MINAIFIEYFVTTYLLKLLTQDVKNGYENGTHRGSEISGRAQSHADDRTYVGGKSALVHYLYDLSRKEVR
jgi:hypothetical protein